MKRRYNNPLVLPFLKWAGGKRQLLPEINKFVPKYNGTYFEPFVGAGAVLLHLQPKKAYINDINNELINCYEVIKHNLNELIDCLVVHKDKHSKNHFYEIRELDRADEYKKLSNVERAARIIYLNKTCYNGLFRVNKQGQFNVPIGNYKTPNILDEPVLKAVSAYLNNSKVEFLNGDFEKAVNNVKKGDFIYFDPPYDPVSDTASFTGYNLDGFNKEEQKRLKLLIDKLTNKGCYVLLSNSKTPYITELYEQEDYEIHTIAAKRAINTKANLRGEVKEVLINNYKMVK